MTVRRLASVSLLVAAFGLLACWCAPAGAQEKKDKPATKSGLDEETTKLLTTVDEAIKARDYRKDAKIGNGRNPYELMPAKPGIVIGFDVFPGRKDKTTDYIRGIKPVWLLNDGQKVLGKTEGWVGDGSGVAHERAKPGYAVAGLKYHNFFGHIQGLSVVYAKVTETGLDMSDSYDSKWYGHEDPNTAKKAACTGEPVLGIHGMVADNYKSDEFGVGLVVMGKEEGKKKKK
jgi:hypothetical protein